MNDPDRVFGRLADTVKGMRYRLELLERGLTAVLGLSLAMLFGAVII